MTAPPLPTRLLLVGMMGAGKTTVGLAAAKATGWRYVDNDALVAELSGAATPDLQASAGGAALHELEAVVVRRILEMEPPLVAGVPGSAIMSEHTRGQLRGGGFVVWLRARIETLAARIGDGSSRPFFAGHDVTETLARLYEGRERLYAACAHLVVDVDGLAPEAVADRIVESLPRT